MSLSSSNTPTSQTVDIFSLTPFSSGEKPPSQSIDFTTSPGGGGLYCDYYSSTQFSTDASNAGVSNQSTNVYLNNNNIFLQAQSSYPSSYKLIGYTIDNLEQYLFTGQISTTSYNAYRNVSPPWFIRGLYTSISSYKQFAVDIVLPQLVQNSFISKLSFYQLSSSDTFAAVYASTVLSDPGNTSYYVGFSNPNTMSNVNTIAYVSNLTDNTTVVDITSVTIGTISLQWYTNTLSASSGITALLPNATDQEILVQFSSMLNDTQSPLVMGVQMQNINYPGGTGTVQINAQTTGVTGTNTDFCSLASSISFGGTGTSSPLTIEGVTGPITCGDYNTVSTSPVTFTFSSFNYNGYTYTGASMTGPNGCFFNNPSYNNIALTAQDGTVYYFAS